MPAPRRTTVIGSGPNGLAAAVALARAGFAVTVLEAHSTPGGSTRTAELTLPGFAHDVGSAVHPAATTSAFFRAFGLQSRIEWIRPEISYAHPLPGGDAAIAWRDLDRTIAGLGAGGAAWRRVLRPLVRHLDELVATVSDSLLRPPPHPVLATRFAARGAQLGSAAFQPTLRTEKAAALLSGVFAHANVPLPSLPAAAAGLFLAAHGHSGDGWAYPRGGAGAIAGALIADLVAHGGEVRTGVPVTSLEHLAPGADDVLILDTAPDLLLTLPGLPGRYAGAVRRYRRGAAVAKVDFALSGPVGWLNSEVARAPTVHLGGSYRQIAAAEREVAAGAEARHPYVIVVQPSVLDASRAPADNQTLWAYIHVPLHSATDPAERVITQIERVAPGFRGRILASVATPASARALFNPADVGGDVLGGMLNVRQALARPVLAQAPWRTGAPGVYLASAATPPGPGVTGMPGWRAAQCAISDTLGYPVHLRDLFQENR